MIRRGGDSYQKVGGQGNVAGGGGLGRGGTFLIYFVCEGKRRGLNTTLINVAPNLPSLESL